MLIFGEVITGFRLRSASSATSRGRARLVTPREIIGGGMTVGATATSASHVAARASGPSPGRHLSGDPIAIAAAPQTLEHLLADDGARSGPFSALGHRLEGVLRGIFRPTISVRPLFAGVGFSGSRCRTARPRSPPGHRLRRCGQVPPVPRRRCWSEDCSRTIRVPPDLVSAGHDEGWWISRCGDR